MPCQAGVTVQQISELRDGFACVVRNPFLGQRICRIVSQFCLDPNTIQVINDWDLWPASDYHIQLPTEGKDLKAEVAARLEEGVEASKKPKKKRNHEPRSIR